MISRRSLPWIVSLLVALTVVSCGSPRREASIEPPSDGALFGAYVDPPVYTESERITSFELFETQLGSQLAIYHDYHRWTDAFPSRSDVYFAQRGTTLLLSWAGTNTRAIIAGRFDGMIRARAEALARLDRPVLLRWRWEMNRPNLASQIGSAADYVAAWRHIHRIFTQVGADNVGWVWCPLSDPRADPAFGSYYPGDSYVDWICADGYARSPDESFEHVFRPFMAWAAGTAKPVLIGEFGQHQGPAGARAAWLQAARAYIERDPRIKAVLYFESARGASGNYSVAGEADALATLRSWVHDPYFNPH